MASTINIINFDSTSLLNFYNAQIGVGVQQAASEASARAALQSSGSGSSSSSSSASSGSTPPWSATQPSQQALDAQVLSTTNFFPPNNAALTFTGGDKNVQSDNQNLFSLYQAVSSLSTLASLAAQDGVTAGQLAGYNTRFQNGLQQVESFLKATTFNNFTLQATAPSSSVTSAVSIPFAPMSYAGGTLAKGDAVNDPVSGVSTSDSFTVSIKKGSTTTAINIDLGQVQGPLTLNNIVSYVNQQISAAGFSTKFSKVMTGGSIDDPANATWGLAISDVPSEQVTLSSASATPSLYIAGSTGSATGVVTGTTTSAPDQTGKLTKLADLSTSPTGTFSQNIAASSAGSITSAQATAVDSNGNVYVIGNSSGDFGTELNQASQDVYLTKYDSAGNVQWTQLLGSSDTASGYSLAVDPTGGVVVAGTTTSDLTATAIADGNNDSFVAKYDSSGNQSWVQQLQTLNNNQGLAVTVDASGNVYLGGQTSAIIGAGQTNAGGTDAYLATFSSSGKLASEQQFGTSGADQVSQLATTSDGGLIAASVQNGHAILSKYANGDITSTPVWTEDLGALGAGGAIGGLTVSGGQIYVSGTSSGITGTPSGTSVANAASGGSDAFVFGVADNGTSATPGNLTYVGTGAKDSGGQVTVGSDGTVYLVGTTTGTFAGQSRTVNNTSNMFVSALNSDGSVQWTRQYGGADGQSTGTGIAIDNSGSSVLDALGLPRGLVTVPQNFDLTSNTTLRPGDSFSINVQGTAARNITVTIDAGETLQSLATKISADMAFIGTAKVTYANGGEALQISVNAGITATLAPGPDGFDALARLGIPAGVLTKAAANGSSSSSSSTASGSAPQVYGLGLTPSLLDLSSQSNAKLAMTTLSTVLSSIKNAYTQSNAPPPSTSTTPNANANGPVPAYLQSQIASYNVALSLFPGATSSSSSSSA